MLYQLMDLWEDYFLVRGITWRGEKEAIRYLRVHDPEFLAAMRRCMRQQDRRRRVEQYAWLVERTMAPVGPLWEENATVLLPQAGADLPPGAAETALAFWEQLIGKRDIWGA